MTLITFTASTKAKASEVNSNNAELNSLMPVGAVIPWLKTYTNTPALSTNWVECNGQTLSDAGSIFNGQVIPNLNASKFLRGSSTSGTTGGSATHSHTASSSYTDNDWTGADSSKSPIEGVNVGSSLPPFYEVVFILRIK